PSYIRCHSQHEAHPISRCTKPKSSGGTAYRSPPRSAGNRSAGIREPTGKRSTCPSPAGNARTWPDDPRGPPGRSPKQRKLNCRCSSPPKSSRHSNNLLSRDARWRFADGPVLHELVAAAAQDVVPVEPHRPLRVVTAGHPAGGHQLALHDRAHHQLEDQVVVEHGASLPDDVGELGRPAHEPHPVRPVPHEIRRDHAGGGG